MARLFKKFLDCIARTAHELVCDVSAPRAELAIFLSIGASVVNAQAITQVTVTGTNPVTVLITGSGFASSNVVTLSGVTLPKTSTSTTSIVATVPSTFTIGASDYLLTVKGTKTATWNLSYGSVGPQGATGPQGNQGSTGTKGDMGPAGPQGPAGPAGPKGDRAEFGGDVAVIDADGMIIARWARLTCSDVVRTDTGDAEPQPLCTVTGYRKDDSGNVYIMEFLQQSSDEWRFGPSKDDPAMPFLGFVDACDGDVPVLPLDNGPWGSVVYQNRIALQRSDNEIWLAVLGQKFEVSGYYRAFEAGLNGPCTYSYQYDRPLPVIAITSFQAVSFKAPLQLKFFE
jgi:hypothetical protein